jgi:hypothetical protein
MDLARMVVARLVVASIALTGGLTGCKPQASTPAPASAPGPEGPDFGVKLCTNPVRSRAGECTTSDCGANSSVVNSFPVNGFSKDASGACNPFGVQLIPHSLEGGRCGRGADLGLDATGTRLVGTRLGQVVCTGEELTGASFLVRSFAHATQAFTISNVRPITMLDGVHSYEGYRIETGSGSACEPDTALRIRRQLGVVPETQGPPDALPKPAGYHVGPHDDLAIAVDGPLYDLHDRVMTGSRDHWFNLACAGDALAKRTLYNLYTADDDARNETALRMLTANYCGKPYTVPGIELEWAKGTSSAATLQHEEALWHAGQAICIGTPRLMTLHVANRGTTISPHDLPAQLQPTGCGDGHCDADSWTRALRAECKLLDCKLVPRTPPPPYEFDSWDFDSDQNHIILARH